MEKSRLWGAMRAIFETTDREGMFLTIFPLPVGCFWFDCKMWFLTGQNRETLYHQTQTSMGPNKGATAFLFVILLCISDIISTKRWQTAN